jgi:hypothetical protein
MPLTFVFTLSEGKFIEWRIFMRSEQALRALGRTE